MLPAISGRGAGNVSFSSFLSYVTLSGVEHGYVLNTVLHHCDFADLSCWDLLRKPNKQEALLSVEVGTTLILSRPKKKSLQMFHR